MVRAAIALLMLVLVPSAVVAQGEKRIALLIGNQVYDPKVGRLKNPHDDVTLVGAALKQLGFQVTILNDADYRAMDVAIKRFVTEVRSKGNDAISFFYYSGHGAANPETQINYLIPVDVTDPNDGNLWYQSFQQNDLIDKLSKQAPNATHYVVFDACRNELNLSGPAAKAIGAEKGFVPVPQTPGLLIAYATAQGRTAADVGNNGGPYARALAAELVKPGIEAVNMFRNVQIRVKDDIGQDPWLSFPALPQVYLAGRTTGTTSMPTPSTTSVAAREWQDVKETTSIAVLERYLQAHKDDPVYAALAQDRIEALKRAQQAKAEAEALTKSKAEADARAKAATEREHIASLQKQEEYRKSVERVRSPLFGVVLSPLTDALRAKYNIAKSVNGVAVLEVDPTSAAAQKRIKVGDVITEVSQEAVTSIEDIIRNVDKTKRIGRKAVLLRLAHGNGDTMFVALPVQ